MPEAVLRTPCQTIARPPVLGDTGTDEPTNQRMRATRRDAADPSDDVPGNGPHQCAEHNERVYDVCLENALADGLGDMKPKEQEGDEVEEGCPEHRVLRAQHPCGNDSRYGIRRVMQPVQKVE